MKFLPLTWPVKPDRKRRKARSFRMRGFLCRTIFLFLRLAMNRRISPTGRLRFSLLEIPIMPPRWLILQALIRLMTWAVEIQQPNRKKYRLRRILKPWISLRLPQSSPVRGPSGNPAQFRLLHRPVIFRIFPFPTIYRFLPRKNRLPVRRLQLTDLTDLVLMKTFSRAPRELRKTNSTFPVFPILPKAPVSMVWMN